MKTKTNGYTTKLPRAYTDRTKRIINAVVEEYNFKNEREMWKSPRTPHNCSARWIVWHYMREMGMPFEMISGYTGHSHGTVMHGIDRLKSDLELRSNAMLRTIYKNIKKTLA